MCLEWRHQHTIRKRSSTRRCWSHTLSRLKAEDDASADTDNAAVRYGQDLSVVPQPDIVEGSRGRTRANALRPAISDIRASLRGSALQNAAA